MLLAAILLLVLIGVSIWLVLGRSKHAIDNLPGPPTVPILGNALDFVTTPEQMLKTFRKFSFTYWPIYRTWLINIPVIHPHSPKDVEAVLTSSVHITKSHEYNLISEWLGSGLLTSRGAKWHKRRKMLTPAFHFKILEEFVPVFNDNIQIFISKLRGHVGKKDGVDIAPLVTHCALDIICETAMGTKVHAQKDKDSEYVSAMYELNDVIVYRAFRPWLFPGWLFRLTPSGRTHDKCIKLLHNFTKKVIRERQAERQKSENKNDESKDNEDNFFGSKKKTAFLDLLLQVREQEGGLTEEDIREEVDTFMFEGHDTTAMAMSWTMYFLGCHKEVQEKCVEELTEIFADSDRDPTWTDLGSMKYLERVIKESLRLRPSVYAIGRQLNTTLKLGKEEFPSGTRINLHIDCIHRNPEIYPDPEKFDPDRFLPENSVGRPPYAYIPFSAGPRNCIGQKFAMLEMKTLLSSALRNFKLHTLNPERDYDAVPDLILRPKHGLTIKIEARK